VHGPSSPQQPERRVPDRVPVGSPPAAAARLPVAVQGADCFAYEALDTAGPHRASTRAGWLRRSTTRTSPRQPYGRT